MPLALLQNQEARSSVEFNLRNALGSRTALSASAYMHLIDIIDMRKAVVQYNLTNSK
jgi:hypothetical protein